MIGALMVAADAYAARAPYQWKVAGDKLDAIASAVGSGTQLVGVTYKRGIAGVYRSILRSQNAGDHCSLERLRSPRITSLACAR